ncbi:MAG: translation initiation factor [Verrucomicrobia bacterium]|nr:MAG: translation initiation factor [Verrucomicrobiota bacterium]
MAKKRIDTSGNANPLTNNPFAALDGSGLPSAPAGEVRATERDAAAASAPAGTGEGGRSRSRGRVDVVREKAGRGGKTVTVLRGFKGIAAAELQALAREIQRRCGVGGTVKGGTIEIQGDQRTQAIEVLEKAGFRAVRAGG